MASTSSMPVSMPMPGAHCNRVTWGVAATLAVALISPAAQAATPVGMLLGDKGAFAKSFGVAFEASLLKLGADVEVMTQRPRNDKLAWANASRRFEVFDVEVIVTVLPPVDIGMVVGNCCAPVIYVGPERTDLLGDRRKFSAVTWHVPLASGIRYMKQLGEVSSVAIVIGDHGVTHQRVGREAAAVRSKMGMDLTVHAVGKAADLAAMPQVQAIYVDESCPPGECLTHAVAWARKNAVPIAGAVPGGENYGLVLTLQPDPAELADKAAGMARKLVAGADASSIPIIAVKKISMTVNLQEAARLNVRVPFEVLTSAGKVIK